MSSEPPTIHVPVLLLILLMKETACWRYMGCYKEISPAARLLEGERKEYRGRLSPELCLSHCSTKGFLYAGLEYGFECYCGQERPPLQWFADPGECSTPCEGDPRSQCGGNWRLAVYDIQNKKVNYVQKYYEGCFPAGHRSPLHSTSSRSQKLKPLESQDMTPEFCVGHCYSHGYRYAATQSWKSCQCGDELDRESGGGQASEEGECALDCAGDSRLLCGGQLWASVYQTSISDESETGKFVGCYIDSKAKRLLSGKILSLRETNSPRRCFNICLQLGFGFAGLENGDECYCGNTRPDEDKETNEYECRSVCPGSTSRACGGQWRLAVYRTLRENSIIADNAVGNQVTNLLPNPGAGGGPGPMEIPTTERQPQPDWTTSRHHVQPANDWTTSRPQYVQQTTRQQQHEQQSPEEEELWPSAVVEQSSTTFRPQVIRTTRRHSSGGDWSTTTVRGPLLGATSSRPQPQRTTSRSSSSGGGQQSGSRTTSRLGEGNVDRTTRTQATVRPSQPTTRKPPKPPVQQTTWITYDGWPSEDQKGQYCTKSKTELGDKFLCQGELLFHERFNTWNPGRWKHEVFMPDEPDYEFVVYDDKKDILFLENGNLVIKPTIYDNDFVREGQLRLEKCTGRPYTSECERVARGFTIIPPVRSARITTKESFAFKYGKVIINARLPAGDWVVPELWLEPKEQAYGPHYQSGRIRLAASSGNRELNTPAGEDIGCQRLSQGLILGTSDGKVRSLGAVKSRSGPWYDGFHNYTLIWTPDNISFQVDDDEKVDLIVDKSKRLYQQVGFEERSVGDWRHGSHIAPFDKPFYLTLGVTVGGMREFPDSCVTGRRHLKPWDNLSVKGQVDFWNDRGSWYPTWNTDKFGLEVADILVFKSQSSISDAKMAWTVAFIVLGKASPDVGVARGESNAGLPPTSIQMPSLISPTIDINSILIDLIDKRLMFKRKKMK